MSQHGPNCRHLGLTRDARQSFPNPSPDHRCYLWDQEGQVDLSHQRDYCLTGRWRDCPWPSAGSAWNRASALRRHPTVLAGVAASMALILMMAVLFWIVSGRGPANIEVASTAADAGREFEASPAVPAGTGANPTSPRPTPKQTPARPGAITSTPQTRIPEPGPTDGKGLYLDITTLADGSADSVLVFTEAGRKSVYIKVPPVLDVVSAKLDISGEVYVAIKVDQKNEASQHESTWGVRAQQFRPSGSVLSSAELFLTRASSNPGDLTLDIREDSGKGFPSAKVLASVSKQVPLGGYRWEAFDFPDVAVKPGQAYWIVSYVKPLDEVAYPATPSIGDYGYYIGMSLRDEYAEGDSVDFLTFPTGSRWEKYATRKTWDLMFRVNSLVNYLPTHPSLNVGDDGDMEWSHTAEFGNTQSTEDFSASLRKYLAANRDLAKGDLLVPLSVRSDSPGIIRVSNVRITGKAPMP